MENCREKWQCVTWITSAVVAGQEEREQDVQNDACAIEQILVEEADWLEFDFDNVRSRSAKFLSLLFLEKYMPFCCIGASLTEDLVDESPVLSQSLGSRIEMFWDNFRIVKYRIVSLRNEAAEIWS